MKIRIIKDVLVEVEKIRLEEVLDQSFRKWDELNVESIIDLGTVSQINTYDECTYLNVPNAAFEVLRG